MLRRFLRRSIPAAALLIAGIIVFAVGNGTTAWFVAGIAMVGVATVAIGSQFFYEVGRSEDRDRAREQARRRRP